MSDGMAPDKAERRAMDPRDRLKEIREQRMLLEVEESKIEKMLAEDEARKIVARLKENFPPSEFKKIISSVCDKLDLSCESCHRRGVS